MAQKIVTSIIIPAYNEAAIIAATLERLAAFVDAHKKELGASEVVVVAAGTDKTAEIARQFAPRFAAMTVVTPPGKVGKGRDVRLGFAAASGEVQVFMDADLSVPLPRTLELVHKLRSGADIAIGVRNLWRIHKSFLRTMLSVAANWLTRVVILPRIRDSQCGFKGFTKAAAQVIFSNQRVDGWGFDIELLTVARENKLRVAQVSIPDWQETRESDLQGSRGVSHAAVATLWELAKISLAAYIRWAERHKWVAPSLAMLLTFMFAFFVGPFGSIWFDEAYTAILIKQPVSQLLHLTAVDVHPPLYYLLVQAWANVWGHTELGLRSFSILCGVLASGVGVLLVRYLFSARAALIAVPFVALAPMLLRYDVEARMYALASLICIAATYVLVRALRAPPKTRASMLLWITYAVLVALGMYTLYYTALVWIAHFVWLLVTLRPGRAFIKQPWMLAYIGAVALFIPWFGAFVGQVTSVQSGFWIGPVTIREVLNVFSMMFSYYQQWQIGPWQSVWLMLGLFVAVWFCITAWRQTVGRQRQYLLLLLLYVFIPMAVLFVASLPPLKPVFLDRYFSHVLIAGYLLLGVLVTLQPTLRRKLVGAGTLLLVLVMGVFSLQQQGNYNFNTLKLPHAEPVAASLARADMTNSVILVDNPGLFFELDFYLDDTHLKFYNGGYTIGSNGGYAILRGSPKEVGSAGQLTEQTVWYMYYEDKPSLTLDHYELASVQTFSDYTLAKYQRK